MGSMREAGWRIAAAVVLGAVVWGGAGPPVWAQGKVGAKARAEEVEEATRLLAEAVKLKEAGRYAAALPIAQRAVALREKALGADHPDVAEALDRLATVYWEMADYARAEPLYVRALALREKALPPGHADIGTSLNNLALLYKYRRDYRRAEPLFERARELWEKTLGPEAMLVSTALGNLAGIYIEKGGYARAEPLYLRALAIREKALGPDAPHLFPLLHGLGYLYLARREYARAEPLFLRAQRVVEKALGRDHPRAADALYGLASLYLARGDYRRAEPMLRRALSIYEKRLGPRHPSLAFPLNQLAFGAWKRGDKPGAAALFQRMVDVQETALGPEDPAVADSLHNLSAIRAAMKDYSGALAQARRAAEIREKDLLLVLAGSSEPESLDYLSKVAMDLDRDPWLAVRTGDRGAAVLALTTVLRRKGRGLDAVAHGMQLVRARLGAPEQKLFDELLAIRTQRSALMLRGPGEMPLVAYRETLGTLAERDRQHQASISARSAQFRVEEQPVTVATVQAALPAGSALVEWSAYRALLLDGRNYEEARGPLHYVACVLPARGEPACVDLGKAAPVDAAVAELRRALSRPADTRAPGLARDLDARVLDPLRGLLGGARQVFLAPDGALNLVPFGALIGADGRPQIDRYSFTYLTSGRDLLRRAAQPPRHGAPLILANPDFGVGAGPAGGQFMPLLHAAEEAEAIRALFPAAKQLEGPAATKAHLSAVHGPLFLHIGTHGYFERMPCAVATDDPMVESGIALAGANACLKGKEDGLLTALEASGLDLYGTQLAVLSACQTGVGDAKAGDGVYGLRRALVLAGAETQVMSLWPVEGTATEQLMKAYYEGLSQGGGRSEAMRQAQLAMLHDGKHEHPYYWASFIVSGDDRSLDGKAVEPDLGVHRRGACACRMGEQPSDEGALWLAGAAAMVLAGRRRGASVLGNQRRPGMGRRWRAWWRVGAAVVLGVAVVCGVGPAEAQGKGGTAEADRGRQIAEAGGLMGKATALQAAGDPDAAIPLAQRALAILEKTAGPTPLSVAGPLMLLVDLYREKGRYDLARPLYQRAISVYETALGPNHPAVAPLREDLAGLGQAKYEQEATRKRKEKGATVTDLRQRSEEKTAELRKQAEQSSEALRLWAQVETLERAGKYDEAIPLAERVLAVWEKTIGRETGSVARVLGVLAELHQATENYDQAERFYQHAVSIYEKGQRVEVRADPTHDLVEVYRRKGEYDRAVEACQVAVNMWDKSTGPVRDTVVGPYLEQLALMHWAAGHVTEAISAFTQSRDLQEKRLARASGNLGEAYAAVYLAANEGAVDTTVTLALGARDPRASKLALTTLLRRKSRVLGDVAASMGAVRSRLDLGPQRFFDELRAARFRYTVLALRGSGWATLSKQASGGPDPAVQAERARAFGAYWQERIRLSQQIPQLEAQITGMSTAISALPRFGGAGGRSSSDWVRAEVQPATVDAVEAALPDDAALVEWTVYRPFNPRARTESEDFGQPRYAAAVLAKHGDPTWIDLGDAASIDSDVNAVRDAFSRPANASASALARNLEAKVMAPVRAFLGGARRVFLSPDSALNLIPFAALGGEDGRPLLERYAFTYLTSGRDLLRRAAPAPLRAPPLILASPDFNVGAPPGAGRFASLLHAEEVTAAASRLFPGTVSLLRERATKANLTNAHGPRVLHIGTHGYFEPTTCGGAPDEEATKNPLLKSGIALAGANACAAGNSGGLLTAAEASALDLYGTRLVVLSACQTGTGDTKAGDGVYGLRRALVLAGAETQVMSLWPVDEAATSKLMEAYYDALGRGKGRSEAMREVQLAMLHDGKHEHPYYWASFIVSGDDRPLDGAAPVMAPIVRPGGACACRMGEVDPGGGAVWLAMAALAGIGMARRRKVWKQTAAAVLLGASAWLGTLDASAQGNGDVEEARKLTKEVVTLYNSGKYDKAVPLAHKALALWEKAPGPYRLDVAKSLTNLAELYRALGENGKAEPLLQRARTIWEEARGPDHPDVAISLNALASLYEATGKYDLAELLYQRALAIREKALGPDHRDVANSLNNLAGFYATKREPSRAEPLYLRALAILEKVWGPDHMEVATCLSNLADLYTSEAEYGRAEERSLRAVAIAEKALPSDHPHQAFFLNVLAELYVAKGEYDRAEPLHRRALAIREKVLPPEHPALANSLDNLAAVYYRKGEYDRAEPLYQRALHIYEQALGSKHTLVANVVNNLAELYRTTGEYDRAEPLYQRAIAIKEGALGRSHPDVASCLHNLAELYRAKGEYDHAEPLYRRSLAIFESASFDPGVATSQIDLSMLLWAADRIPEAVVVQSRGADVREKTLSRLVATGSEAQKLTLLRPYRGEQAVAATLALRTHDAGAGRLALLTLFRRKGRALGAMAESYRTLRAQLGPVEQELLDQLQSARSHDVALSLGGPGKMPLDVYQRERVALDERIRDLEARISARSAVFRAEEPSLTVNAVQKALPDAAALVEWAVYQPFNPKARTEREKWGPSRYAASILLKQGDPAWLDIGDEAAINADIQSLRDAFSRPATEDSAALSRALEARVMAPVRALLGDTRHVFLSPDGALNLVPFGALVGDVGRPLVERYSFTYLTSGRDLLRRAFRAAVREPPILAVAPDFDLDKPAGRPFPPLLHTDEVRDLVAARFQHPAPVVLSGKGATKERLQQVHGPQFLHIGSHGYFRPNVCTEHPSADLRDKPLLRSGIALAGANACAGGDNRGLLTASEASGLDLYGTRLVVLSACETGVGQAEAGDGVYGLRRALVLAGAETQVMSLWPVNEAATTALMTAYYEALAKGQGRSESMRQAQLAMLHDGRHEHSYYWASFIVSGDDRELDGGAAGPPPVIPGGACTCRAGARGPDGGSKWLAAAALAVGVARRRRGQVGRRGR